MNTISSGGQTSGLIPFYPDTGSPLTQLDAKATKQQMEKVGTEFESLFMSMLLKEMRQIEGEENGLFSGDGGDVYGGLFDLMMGQSLAQNSPLNIAQLVNGYNSASGDSLNISELDAQDIGELYQEPNLATLNSVI